MMPMKARRADPEVMSPRATRVDSSFTTMPALLRPMNAMKRPIPAPIALRRLAGMALTIASRTLVIVRMMNTRPSISTAVNANCHGYPIPRHTLYTKKALRPIPGASPKGSFPMKAIARQPIMAARAVDVNTAPPGIDRSLNMDGFTARM